MKWILSRTAAIESLKDTQLNFVKYSDLVNFNALWDTMGEISNKRFKRKKIPDWIDYQLGKKDLSREDFYRFFFNDLDESEVVLIVTDEGHRKEWVFKIFVHEFMAFSEWHEEYFCMDFFQFSDYLVVFPDLNKIRYMHDEGLIMEYEVFFK